MMITTLSSAFVRSVFVLDCVLDQGESLFHCVLVHQRPWWIYFINLIYWRSGKEAAVKTVNILSYRGLGTK